MGSMHWPHGMAQMCAVCERESERGTERERERERESLYVCVGVCQRSFSSISGERDADMNSAKIPRLDSNWCL